jgi:hypothetical protein
MVWHVNGAPLSGDLILLHFSWNCRLDSCLCIAHTALNSVGSWHTYVEVTLNRCGLLCCGQVQLPVRIVTLRHKIKQWISNIWHVGYPYAVQLGDHKWHRLKLLVWGGSHYTLHFVPAVLPFSFVMYVVYIMLGAVRSFCVYRFWNAWRRVVGLVRWLV